MSRTTSPADATASTEALLPGVGRIAISATAAGLVRATILKPDAARVPRSGSGAAAAMRDRACAELAAYPGGGPLGCPVVLDPIAGFSRRVLLALRRVPRGTVIGYGALAELAGSPGAARAVGNAMARNPIPLWVPCHRVVASGGLGGYSGGGGLATKRALLALEGYDLAQLRRGPAYGATRR